MPYLVTSALPYANGPLHIGHLAGAYLPADIYVRYLRLQAEDVVYVCGSDEHGAAITTRAKKEGTTPQAIIDKYHEQFKRAFEGMGISFDVYHRTSSRLHHEVSQDFFRTLYERGAFEQHTEQQYYDVAAEQFLADRYITGTCPKCGYEEAYGDQCENCGSTLNPTDLINPRSTLSGAEPELRETTHFYLPLNEHETMLRAYLQEGKVHDRNHHEPSTWKNHVLGQSRSWLDDGLQPRAMTRDLTWGVDVPQEIPGSTGKKLYVWLDAPIGYISATQHWAEQHGKNWEQYWKGEDANIIHFIGKDNIVFHCIIFPTILHLHGDYNLPKNVPANQFMNLEGRKISTSKNWAVWVLDYLADFPERVDELRYNMIKNMPEQRDSEFTWRNYQETTNNELVANLGNVVQRVMTLVNKYYEGVVPDFERQLIIRGDADGNPTSYTLEMQRLQKDVQQVADSIEQYDYRGALQRVMDIASRGNQLIQFNEPWKGIKTEPERVAVLLNFGVQQAAALAIVIRPFLPGTSDKLQAMLGLPPLRETGEWVALNASLKLGNPLVPTGHGVNTPTHLFTRLKDADIDAQVEKLNAGMASAAAESAVADISYEPLRDTASFEDFVKLDFRTGVITAAEKMKKAKKLLQLTVDLGFESRTVVSGIAEHYSPDEIIGQQVVVVANLAPRKLRGVESQGMILMAENSEGQLVFVQPSEAQFGGGYVVR